MAVRRDARWFARREALRVLVQERVPRWLAWCGVAVWSAVGGVLLYLLFLTFLGLGGLR